MTTLKLGGGEAVERFAREIQERHGLQQLSLYLTSRGDLHLDMIEVPRAARKRGVGTAAMEDIVRFADENGLRVTLTLGLADDVHGTTSRGRLVRFYKRFGFVENKGRNKDFSIREGMYREPSPLDSFERQHLLAWCRSTMQNPEHVARFMEEWLSEPGRDVEYYKREGWARVASACGAYEVDFALDATSRSGG